MAGSLCCEQCQERFVVRHGIPILIPRQAYMRFPIDKVKNIYDRAYGNPGIMGTQFDLEYSQVTKTLLLSFCLNAPNPRILDVGTGDGDLWEFVPSSYNWYAIDISEVGIRRALQRYPDLHAAVAIAEWLPYPDGFFGAVTAVDTIEHTFDLEQSLRSVKRVLARGGIFAFSVPTPNSLRKWGYNHMLRGRLPLKMLLRLVGILIRRTMIFGTPIFQPIDRDITLEGWQATMDAAGFRVITIQESVRKLFDAFRRLTTPKG